MSKIIVLHDDITVEEEAEIYRHCYLAEDPVDNTAVFWAFALCLMLWCWIQS